MPALLDHLASLPGSFEVLVADGGSSDETGALARSHPLGPTVVEAGPGRANQLNRAAAVAAGELILFLHADTRLPAGAYASLANAWRAGGVVGGNFALRFGAGERFGDGDDLFARILGAVRALERRTGIYYGDSAIFARREAFEALHGFRPLPIMDDYDFARRLERLGRTICLPGPAVTSDRRWRSLGVVRTVALWNVIRALYLLGVDPARLARLYGPVR